MRAHPDAAASKSPTPPNLEFIDALEVHEPYFAPLCRPAGSGGFQPCRPFTVRTYHYCWCFVQALKSSLFHTIPLTLRISAYIPFHKAMLLSALEKTAGECDFVLFRFFLLTVWVGCDCTCGRHISFGVPECIFVLGFCFVGLSEQDVPISESGLNVQ